MSNLIYQIIIEFTHFLLPFLLSSHHAICRMHAIPACVCVSSSSERITIYREFPNFPIYIGNISGIYREYIGNFPEFPDIYREYIGNFPEFPDIYNFSQYTNCGNGDSGIDAASGNVNQSKLANCRNGDDGIEHDAAGGIFGPFNSVFVGRMCSSDEECLQQIKNEDTSNLKMVTTMKQHKMISEAIVKGKNLSSTYDELLKETFLQYGVTLATRNHIVRKLSDKSYSISPNSNELKDDGKKMIPIEVLLSTAKEFCSNHPGRILSIRDLFKAMKEDHRVTLPLLEFTVQRTQGQSQQQLVPLSGQSYPSYPSQPWHPSYQSYPLQPPHPSLLGSSKSTSC